MDPLAIIPLVTVPFMGMLVVLTLVITDDQVTLLAGALALAREA